MANARKLRSKEGSINHIQVLEPHQLDIEEIETSKSSTVASLQMSSTDLNNSMVVKPNETDTVGTPRSKENKFVQKSSVDNVNSSKLKVVSCEPLTAKPPQKKTTSKYRGVNFEKNRTLWRASIYVNEKQNHLGYFKSEQDAAIAYDNASAKVRGKRVNFPNAVAEIRDSKKLDENKLNIELKNQTDKKLNGVEWDPNEKCYITSNLKQSKEGQLGTLTDEESAAQKMDAPVPEPCLSEKGTPQGIALESNVPNSKQELKKNASRSSSKFRGVYWHKTSGAWCAQIKIENKRKHLGLFDSEEDAAKEYDYWAKKIHGDSINPTLLNFKLSSDKNSSETNSKRAIKTHHGSSEYRGVSWFKANQVWKAQITVNGRYEYLGYFDNEKDAAKAYDARAIQVHGKNAQLNFPDSAVTSSIAPYRLKGKRKRRSSQQIDTKLLQVDDAKVTKNNLPQDQIDIVSTSLPIQDQEGNNESRNFFPTYLPSPQIRPVVVHSTDNNEIRKSNQLQPISAVDGNVVREVHHQHIPYANCIRNETPNAPPFVMQQAPVNCVVPSFSPQGQNIILVQPPQSYPHHINPQFVPRIQPQAKFVMQAPPMFMAQPPGGQPQFAVDEHPVHFHQNSQHYKVPFTSIASSQHSFGATGQLDGSATYCTKGMQPPQYTVTPSFASSSPRQSQVVHANALSHNILSHRVEPITDSGTKIQKGKGQHLSNNSTDREARTFKHGSHQKQEDYYSIELVDVLKYQAEEELAHGASLESIATSIDTSKDLLSTWLFDTKKLREYDKFRINLSLVHHFYSNVTINDVKRTLSNGCKLLGTTTTKFVQDLGINPLEVVDWLSMQPGSEQESQSVSGCRLLSGMINKLYTLGPNKLKLESAVAVLQTKWIGMEIERNFQAYESCLSEFTNIMRMYHKK